MNIDWEKSINSRRSTRSYRPDAISDVERDQLNLFINQLETPFSHQVAVQLFKALPNRALYSVLTSPEDNMAFISETDMVSISKAGFVGELVVLYATSLGLSTCWYGHYTLAELEKQIPHLGESKNDPQPRWGYDQGVVPGRRVIAVTPVGYANREGIRWMDRMQSQFFSYKRKAIDELLTGKMKADRLSDELRFALDLARKAPSAANSQFWRFAISDDQKQIRLSMPPGYQHIKWEHPNVDIGIAASHLWLGLNLAHIAVTVDLVEENGCAIWTFQLT